ncbi:transposase [Chitinophaga sp. sic0106]|uniref:transposase n=1 Tax=Chitinophaga sp. sic0106 TaxID=2854785 RepID=UPI001C44B6C5|nr:transposase [Chitinophaga sp. sic0106]MBV7531562.1 hypothetical protein [Chitinophaga sp. sic0106]
MNENNEKFQGKYRVHTACLRNWNYGDVGSYFVTICTNRHECNLGYILNNEFIPFEMSKIVAVEWIKTFEMRQDMNLQLDKFIVMPNHIHAIIHIGENKYNKALDINSNLYGVQSKNLPAIIRGFKASVKKQAIANKIKFEWQPRYHEHIIRTESAYQLIAEYIENNPERWRQDKFYR